MYPAREILWGPWILASQKTAIQAPPPPEGQLPSPLALQSEPGVSEQFHTRLGHLGVRRRGVLKLTEI